MLSNTEVTSRMWLLGPQQHPKTYPKLDSWKMEKLGHKKAGGAPEGLNRESAK